MCVLRGRIDSPPIQLTSSPPTYGQNTLRVTSTQGRCHCGVAAMPCCVREHACSAAAPSHHLPPSLLAQARVASTQCAAIKGGHLCILSATAPCLPLLSRRHRTSYVFRRSVGAKLPHPTSLPVRRSRSSARPQSCSQTSSSHTFTAVELWCHRPRQ
jgi:hypothetical protein